MSGSCFLFEPLAELAEAPVVVLPACDRDCQMLIKNLDWMVDLDGLQPYAALVAQDHSMNKILSREVLAAAKRAFREVNHFVYDAPPVGAWPYAANWAFQHTAWYMYFEMKRPWFWCEADCVPLRAGWLKDWAAEYRLCGKQIMGAIVDGRGHCNGTAIYPPEFPELSPLGMQAKEVAWDWVMREETIHLTHHSALMCHVWGIENGKVSSYGGNPAWFAKQQDVDAWVCPNAVLFHRSKDGTLIDRLRERRKQGRPWAANLTGGGGGNLVTA